MESPRKRKSLARRKGSETLQINTGSVPETYSEEGESEIVTGATKKFAGDPSHHRTRKSRKKTARYAADDATKTSSRESRNASHVVSLLVTASPENIGPDVKEEMCKSKCLYNALPGIYQDKGPGVMKRTPFLACKMCLNPYLNMGALLTHLTKKHCISKDKHVGVHVCIASAARYFETSDVRSSDLPMEFRGTCWLDKCEYGCCNGTPVTQESQMLRPVACTVCRQPYASVAGVLQHIEREHDLALLRHYIHICPDIYRKANLQNTDSTDSSAKATTTQNRSQSTLYSSANEKLVVKLEADVQKFENSSTDTIALIPSIVENVIEHRTRGECKLHQCEEDLQEDAGQEISPPKATVKTKSRQPPRHMKIRPCQTFEDSDVDIESIDTETVEKLKKSLSVTLPEGSYACLISARLCRYGCNVKEKYMRGVKMSHMIACKQCCVAYYSIGSFQNHCEVVHAQDKHRVHKYLHICTPTIVEYFDSIKNRAEKEEIKFFRRWYFYDNCHGNTCEFGCVLKKPFACKVCRDTYSLVESAVQHIEDQHDTVSIKPLLHICPAMLGDPPIRPMGEVNKHRAITHHCYVRIANKNAKFATPIRPIQRKGTKTPLNDGHLPLEQSAAISSGKEAFDRENTIQDTLNKELISIERKVSFADSCKINTGMLIKEELPDGSDKDLNVSGEMRDTLNFGVEGLTDEGGLFNEVYGTIQVKPEQSSDESDSSQPLLFTALNRETDSLSNSDETDERIKVNTCISRKIKSEPKFDLSDSWSLNGSLDHSHVLMKNELTSDMSQKVNTIETIDGCRVLGSIISLGF